MTLALVAMVAASSTSALPPVGEKNNGFSKADERYLATYKDCWEAFGADCGRNRVDDGNEDGTQPTDAQVVASTERMQGWLHPEPAPVPASSSTEGVAVPTPVETSVPAAPVSTGSGCVGMEAESGSLGYAEPGGDGYVGCYQISEDHYDGGSCSGLGTDPAGQDACAAIICQTEGAGAWTNPSGQNPCGRLGG